jgi:hypothetical protein
MVIVYRVVAYLSFVIVYIYGKLLKISIEAEQFQKINKYIICCVFVCLNVVFVVGNISVIVCLTFLAPAYLSHDEGAL